LFKSKNHVRAAVDEVQSTQTMPAAVLEIAHEKAFADAAVYRVESRAAPAVFFVVQKRSLIHFAPGRINPEPAERAVDKFSNVSRFCGAERVRAESAFAAVQKKAFVNIPTRHLVDAAIPVLTAARQPATEITICALDQVCPTFHP
jgi:hypothetical protein